MPDSPRPKVFCIGFHKTGTTSLGAALAQLGYRVTGPNWVYHGNIARSYRSRCRAVSHLFDAFQDNPWPLVYAEMEEMWPTARFILTTRDADRWLASATAHFGAEETPMRRLIYGTAQGAPLNAPDQYKARYLAHNAAVRAHFATRPGALLELDLGAERDPWRPLCTFLDQPRPDTPFPHANAAGTDRRVPLAVRVRRRVQRLYL
ncbi:sulfotransferase family protein [Pseudooceanicola sp. MF1-13]|uniref:sulfotransferase family protein n=1 Tax=Pseudooceanicola sp. MF1-13 TaxID=3379095 RepID=UPI0038919166